MVEEIYIKYKFWFKTWNERNHIYTSLLDKREN